MSRNIRTHATTYNAPFMARMLGEKTWAIIGHIAYVVLWPAIWVYLRISPPRTRVVIAYNGKILLLKDWLSDGSWSLPGGGLHRGEDAKHGAIREVFEETGLKIKLSDLEARGTIYAKSASVSVTLHCFSLALKQSPHITLHRHEISDCMWIRPREVAKIKMSSTVRRIITEVAGDPGAK